MAALLAMALAALALCGGVAGAGRALLAGRGFAGLTLVVASEDEDARIDAMVNLLANMRDVRTLATIRKAAPRQARRLVQNGEANVAVVLPRGFFASVMDGENLSPSLLVDTSRPLEAMLTVKLAESAAQMLASAQQGVGFTLQSYSALRPKTPPVQRVVRDINLSYANWVLGRAGMFRTQRVSMAGALNLGQFYLLSGVVFFALLCLPVLYNVFAHGGQVGWLLRLRGAGCPLWVYTAAQLLAGALALLPMLCLLLAGAGLLAGQAAPSVLLLPGLLVCALFLSCLGFLCCNTGSVLSAASLLFLLAGAGLMVFGGLVPKALLPGALAALAPFSPVGWMHSALAPVYGVAARPAALWTLLALALLLFAGCLLLANRRERGRRP